MYYIQYSFNKTREKKILTKSQRENTYTTLYCIYKRNPHINGHMQFKPKLLTGQL